MTETRRINLNGKEVVYSFKRSHRKSVGLRIDDSGLVVSAPLGESIQWIEFVLNKKSSWLIKKLGQRESRQSTQLIWKKTSVFPLLGQDLSLAVFTMSPS